MSGHHPTQRYRQVQIETAAKDDLLLLLLDGGVRFAEGARLELEKGADGEADRRHDQLVRAQKIVLELMGALSPAIGLELFQRLQSLYQFTFTRFFEGNIEGDIVKIDEGIQVLRQIRDMWREAVEKARREKQSPVSKPPASSTFSVQG